MAQTDTGPRGGHPTSIEEVDLFDPATQEDWLPTYDLLREEAPVWRMPGTDTYVLTRFDDISYVLRRTDVFRRGASESTPGRGMSARTHEIYAGQGVAPRVVPRLRPAGAPPLPGAGRSLLLGARCREAARAHHRHRERPARRDRRQGRVRARAGLRHPPTRAGDHHHDGLPGRGHPRAEGVVRGVGAPVPWAAHRRRGDLRRREGRGVPAPHPRHDPGEAGEPGRLRHLVPGQRGPLQRRAPAHRRRDHRHGRPPLHRRQRDHDVRHHLGGVAAPHPP